MLHEIIDPHWNQREIISELFKLCNDYERDIRKAYEAFNRGVSDEKVSQLNMLGLDSLRYMQDGDRYIQLMNARIITGVSYALDYILFNDSYALKPYEPPQHDSTKSGECRKVLSSDWQV